MVQKCLLIFKCYCYHSELPKYILFSSEHSVVRGEVLHYTALIVHRQHEHNPRLLAGACATHKRSGAVFPHSK